MARRFRCASLLLLCAALCGPMASTAFAGDEPPAGASDAVVAAYLEGLKVRMQAKADEARLLEALDMKKEALDALQELATMGKRADEVVLALRAPASPAGPGVPPALAALVRTNPDAPDHAVITAACAFLSRAQGADGVVSAAAARKEGDPAPEGGHDLAVTAAAVMAWLDAVEYLGGVVEGKDSKGPAGPTATSALRGAEALVAAQTKDGRFRGGDTLDDHLLATWALATARGRFERPEWDAPLDRAVTYALDSQGEDGWWGVLGDDRDAAALRTAIAFATLQEVRSLRLPKERAEAVETSMWRSLVRALTVPAETTAKGKLSGVVGRSLLIRRALGLGAVRPNTEYRLEPDPAVPLLGGETPERRLARLEEDFWPRFDPADGPRVDPGALPLVFGTVYAWGGTSANWRRWRENVLRPAVESRVKEGAAAGSWSPVGDPRGERYGRAFTTAFHVLAALHAVVPYVPPKGS